MTYNVFGGTLNPTLLLLITFSLNCGLHAVSVGKPSARISHFWTFQIFYIQIRMEFQFYAHP